MGFHKVRQILRRADFSLGVQQDSTIIINETDSGEHYHPFYSDLKAYVKNPRRQSKSTYNLQHLAVSILGTSLKNIAEKKTA